MQKKDWLFALSPVLVVWLIDRFTKVWAMGFTADGPHWYKWGAIVMHKNPGAMLGMFSDLPPILRIVSLATSGVFLIFVFAIIQYFLPGKVMKLRVGLSILLGGILGNVADRIVWGSVVDFIVLGSGDRLSPAFNLADSLQWVGYLLIVYVITLQSNQIWPENNSRNRLWIDPKYQLKYSLTLASVSIWFSLIIGVFAFTFMKVMISEFILNGTGNAQKYLTPFVTIVVILSLSFAIGIFLLGRHLSHRSVGPVFAFKNFIRDLRKGKHRRLKLRENDEFKDLEDIAEQLLDDYQFFTQEVVVEEEKSSSKKMTGTDYF